MTAPVVYVTLRGSARQALEFYVSSMVRAEFYGLYGMVGRFSAITGPIIWAAITALTVRSMGLAPHVGQGYAVVALLGMVLVAMFILRPVTDSPRDWTGLANP